MAPDEASFNVLWERHRKDVDRAIRHVLKKQGTAETVRWLTVVGQEALWKASLRYRPSKNPRNSFWTFARYRVYGALLDELRLWDHLTRHGRRMVKEGNTEKVSWLLLHKMALMPTWDVSGDDNPEARVSEREKLERVRQAAQTLPANERRAILGLLDDHLPLGPIGRELGVSESRVVQLRYQAIAKIRQILKI